MPLTRTRGIHMPAARLTGVTFMLLTDVQDVRMLHSYDRTADIKILSFFSAPFPFSRK